MHVVYLITCSFLVSGHAQVFGVLVGNRSAFVKNMTVSRTDEDLLEHPLVDVHHHHHLHEYYHVPPQNTPSLHEHQEHQHPLQNLHEESAEHERPELLPPTGGDSEVDHHPGEEEQQLTNKLEFVRDTSAKGKTRNVGYPPPRDVPSAPTGPTGLPPDAAAYYPPTAFGPAQDHAYPPVPYPMQHGGLYSGGQHHHVVPYQGVQHQHVVPYQGVQHQHVVPYQGVQPQHGAPYPGVPQPQHVAPHHRDSGVLHLKKILVPLAGIAILGAAAALVSHPVLLQLGVMSGIGKRRRKRDSAAPGEYSSSEDDLEDLQEDETAANPNKFLKPQHSTPRKNSMNITLNQDSKMLALRMREMEVLEQFMNAQEPGRRSGLAGPAASNVLASLLTCTGFLNPRKSNCLQRMTCEAYSRETTLPALEMQVIQMIVQEMLEHDGIPRAVKHRLKSAVSVASSGRRCSAIYRCPQKAWAQCTSRNPATKP